MYLVELNFKRIFNCKIVKLQKVIVETCYPNVVFIKVEGEEYYILIYFIQESYRYFGYIFRWSVFIVLSCMVFLIVLLLSCGLCCNCWAFLKNPGEREQRVRGGRKCITWYECFIVYKVITISAVGHIHHKQKVAELQNFQQIVLDRILSIMFLFTNNISFFKNGRNIICRKGSSKVPINVREKL